MKKIIMVLLGLAVILSMAGVVSADGTTTQSFTQEDLGAGDAGTKTATVTLTLEELFTVTLPHAFILETSDDGVTYTDLAALEVDVIRLDVGDSINVSVSSENYGPATAGASASWNLVQMESNGGGLSEVEDGIKLPYQMGFGTLNSHIGYAGNMELHMSDNGDGTFTAAQILSTAEDKIDYYIHVKMTTPTGSNVESSIYQDQLTFTVNIFNEEDNTE